MALTNLVRNNSSLTAEEKYDKFVERYQGLELRITQKDIAAYLGITPEFLSRIKRKRKKMDS
ncbi:helix-turn-helix domain-containing protein [Aquimarina sp. I32.4]|uniref:helix-turn-helix domain-containing protein n=1 Tax=Aquimarina sp. I32.4 TaxID=2053903 RepID=UPI001304E991|nr:helix-turn-helix domain-containing protein [Aquimarina sp. I32.4]